VAIQYQTFALLDNRTLASLRACQRERVAAGRVPRHAAQHQQRDRRKAKPPLPKLRARGLSLSLAVVPWLGFNGQCSSCAVQARLATLARRLQELDQQAAEEEAQKRLFMGTWRKLAYVTQPDIEHTSIWRPAPRPANGHDISHLTCPRIASNDHVSNHTDGRCPQRGEGRVRGYREARGGRGRRAPPHPVRGVLWQSFEAPAAMTRIHGVIMSSLVGLAWKAAWAAAGHARRSANT
jgi:hypothetical protein